MAICGYLVMAAPGATQALARELATLAGCDVLPAANRDLLLLVTETDGPAQDEALRARIEATAGVAGLLLTFGEVSAADPGQPRPGDA